LSSYKSSDRNLQEEYYKVSVEPPLLRDTLINFTNRHCAECHMYRLRQKFIISVTVIDFFAKFTAFKEEDSGHIHSKFCYNINYGLKFTTI